MMMTENYGILKKARGKELGWRRVRGYTVPYSSALGVGQYFSNMCLSRISKQKPCNLIFVGEAGSSKSYSAIAWARFLDPSFSIRNVAFTHSEFLDLMINLKEGEIIVLDEPSYTMGHRDWYDAQNKALVSTLRSGRFKVHPVFLPVLNKRLLDKVVRENLLQFMVVMTDRGEGNVYRLSSSQFTSNTWNVPICKLYIDLLDAHKCTKSWCYSCEELESCGLLRGQYERKRRDIQEMRYKEDYESSVEEDRKRKPKEEYYEEIVGILKNNPDSLCWVTKGGVKKLSTIKITKALGCSSRTSQWIRQYLKEEGYEDSINIS